MKAVNILFAKFLDFQSKFSSLGRDKRDFHGKFAESMFTVERLKSSKSYFHDEDIYADDGSDNKDVPMITNASSSSQETSLAAHVSVPSQEEIEKMIIYKKQEQIFGSVY